MENCIFCKIAKGDIPSNKIYEDDELLCFLDITPLTKGHALLIPKEHYPKMTDMPDELYSKLILKGKELTKKLTKELNADGFNMLVLGEDVDHAHFHIIPRYYDSSEKPITLSHTADPEAKEFEKILERLK